MSNEQKTVEYGAYFENDSRAHLNVSITYVVGNPNEDLIINNNNYKTHTSIKTLREILSWCDRCEQDYQHKDHIEPAE